MFKKDHFGVGEPLNEPGDGPGLVVRGMKFNDQQQLIDVMARSSLIYKHDLSSVMKFIMTTYVLYTNTGTHYLLVNPSLAGNHPVSLIRPLAQQMFMRPWMSFSTTSLSFTNWKNNFRTEVYYYLLNCEDENLLMS